MELHLGKMTQKELSLWFGLSEKGLSNASSSAREKKFEILKNFADYHFEGKSVYIDRIINPTYTNAYKIIESKFNSTWGHVKDNNGEIESILKKQRIDTCSRVGSAIWTSNPEVKSQIALRTARDYTNKIKVEKYGHNHLNDKGTDGYCEYVWMNKKGTAPLDEESLKILKECQRIAYGSASEMLACIDDDYHKGVLTKEERDQAVGEINTMDNYNLFIELVYDKLGFEPEKRTKLIDMRYYGD